MAILVGATLWSQSIVIPGSSALCGHGRGFWFSAGCTGNSSGFVNWGEPALCANEGFDYQHLPPGAHLSFALGFWSLDNRSTHTWDALAIHPPYTLVSVSPALPVPILNSSAARPDVSGGANVEVTVAAPSVPGNYGLPSGTLTVD